MSGWIYVQTSKTNCFTVGTSNVKCLDEIKLLIGKMHCYTLSSSSSLLQMMIGGMRAGASSAILWSWHKVWNLFTAQPRETKSKKSNFVLQQVWTEYFVFSRLSYICAQQVCRWRLWNFFLSSNSFCIMLLPLMGRVKWGRWVCMPAWLVRYLCKSAGVI